MAGGYRAGVALPGAGRIAAATDRAPAQLASRNIINERPVTSHELPIA